MSMIKQKRWMVEELKGGKVVFERLRTSVQTNSEARRWGKKMWKEGMTRVTTYG